MKKLFVMLSVVISIVGCQESGEKAANKITNESTAADQLFDQAATEYAEATEGKALSQMSITELGECREKLMSSRTHLTQARAKYQRTLDIDKKNDQVKLINSDEIKKMIVKIDKIIAMIDIDIANVNATRKVRLAESKTKKH